jgi:hypothetical protein
MSYWKIISVKLKRYPNTVKVAHSINAILDESPNRLKVVVHSLQ